MARIIPVLLLILTLTACRSGPWGPYSSPRIIGQVLAADTQQPLEGVKVLRGKPVQRPSVGGEPKGGELLMAKSAALSGADGRFALSSERFLTIFRGSGWSLVRLNFEAPGFYPLQTNLSSLALATNGPSGEPLLDVGEVRLQRVR